MFGYESVAYWHWWVLAVLLFILEVFSPAAFFLWIGLAAVIVGIVVFTIDPSWQIQVLLLAILSVSSVMIGRMWFRRNPIETDQPNLNRRGHELIGRVFTIEQGIVNGTGRIRVGDSTWKVRGPDAEVGRQVKVVDIDSAVLLVELVGD